jgi:hypothetical protein
MRILKISDVFFPRVNGVSTSIETFRRDLTALGHEVVLVAPDYPPAAAAGRAAGPGGSHHVSPRIAPGARLAG